MKCQIPVNATNIYLTNMNKHAWFVLVYSSTTVQIVSSLLAVFVIGRLLVACMCFLTRATSYNLESRIKYL